MDWYVGALKKYAVFGGRARRTEYWFFVLFNIIFGFAAGIADGVLGTVAEDGTGLLGSLYTLAVLLPSLAVGVRRLHDTGKSGWWMLLALVPLAGLVLLFFFIEEGTRGPNQYGPDPKSAVADNRGVPAPAAWLPDPLSRHQYRYWNGASWTQHVSDGGVTATDPIHIQ